MAKSTDNVYRPCPCGSGEKYKFCCLDKDRSQRRDLAREGGWNLIPGGALPSESQIDAAEEAHKRGGELVEQLRGREAIPHLERAIRLCPVIPFPYNNLAMAYFIEGEVEKALEICERVDRVVDPGNVFALGQRVHYLLLLGRRPEAEETGRRLLSLPGRDEFAVYKKCDALARLRRHSDVHAVASRALPSALQCRESFAFFAGTAAANLARYDEAVRLLEDSLEDRTHGGQAERHLKRLRRHEGPGTLLGEWPYLEWGRWTPPSFLEHLKSPEKARRYPGFVETIASLLDDRLEDGAPLQILGLLDTPEAIDLLKKVAFGIFGEESIRFEALSVLLDKGIVSPDDPVQMWIGGEWRKIRPIRQELTYESSNPLPKELGDSMRTMLSALKSRKWSKAEALGREIVSKAPDNSPALYNLAMALRYQERKKEATDLLRQVIAKDPSYLFAPASLATMMLDEGKVEEARKILQATVPSEKVNPDGYVLYLLAEASVSAVEGRFEEAARAWRIAEKTAPDHPAVEQSRGNLARLLSERASEFLEGRRERLERQHRRLLQRRAPLEECVKGYTLAQLQDMGRALGLERVTGMRKEELAARLVAFLKNAEAVRAHLRALPEKSREALRQVWAAGDGMSYDQFTKAFSTRDEEDERPSFGAVERPLDRLTELGFLAVGTVENRASVIIPLEIRPVVDAEFSSSAASALPLHPADQSPGS